MWLALWCVPSVGETNVAGPVVLSQCGWESCVWPCGVDQVKLGVLWFVPAWLGVVWMVLWCGPMSDLE